MRRHLILLWILTIVCESWSVPKPMESVENYNILMVQCCFGSIKGQATSSLA